MVRNQPDTDYYEKYEEYKNCKNNDAYGYCSDYDKYGNCGSYEEYRSSGNCGDLGKCDNYENYESYNIKTCKNYKNCGGCKKFKCKKSCCSPCCPPNCHCRRIKHYKKCRKTQNYGDCGDNYVEDYRYVKNYNNCDLGKIMNIINVMIMKIMTIVKNWEIVMALLKILRSKEKLYTCQHKYIQVLLKLEDMGIMNHIK